MSGLEYSISLLCLFFVFRAMCGNDRLGAGIREVEIRYSRHIIREVVTLSQSEKSSSVDPIQSTLLTSTTRCQSAEPTGDRFRKKMVACAPSRRGQRGQNWCHFLAAGSAGITVGARFDTFILNAEGRF